MTPVHATLRGFAVRALYEQGTLAVAATGDSPRALSRAVPPIEAGLWLDGFLGNAGQILVHDAALAGIIDGWISGLGEDDFTALLPMLRRAFSSIDRVERRRLLDMLRRPMASAGASPDGEPASTSEPTSPGFEAALPLLLTILGIDRGESRP
jgi:hypothetical protein